MAPAIHQAATSGFANAASYDTHRPSYPSESVQKLLEHLGLAGQSGARIIDLAAGTGKLTELLAWREEGYEIQAIEPHDSMRQTLEEKRLKGVDSVTGTAEKMNVEDGWADVVVAAQAFHWFAKEEAVKEIHRVLKPGGKLAMIWNIEDYNKPRSWKATTSWEQQLHELVIDAATDGQPRYRNDVWREVFTEPSVKAIFSLPLGEHKTPWTIWLTKEALWERLRTLSHIAILESEDNEAFYKKYEEILKGDVNWNEKGEAEVHGTTPFAWTTKL